MNMMELLIADQQCVPRVMRLDGFKKRRNTCFKVS